jgi:hypothetical protein
MAGRGVVRMRLAARDGAIAIGGVGAIKTSPRRCEEREGRGSRPMHSCRLPLDLRVHWRMRDDPGRSLKPPKGRKSIARGASPWNRNVRIRITFEPQRGDSRYCHSAGTVAPLGLDEDCHSPLESRGFRPLAIDRRPLPGPENRSTDRFGAIGSIVPLGL